jgi:hypothetical protein
VDQVGIQPAPGGEAAMAGPRGFQVAALGMSADCLYRQTGNLGRLRQGDWVARRLWCVGIIG